MKRQREGQAHPSSYGSYTNTRKGGGDVVTTEVLGRADQGSKASGYAHPSKKTDFLFQDNREPVRVVYTDPSRLTGWKSLVAPVPCLPPPPSDSDVTDHGQMMPSPQSPPKLS